MLCRTRAIREPAWASGGIRDTFLAGCTDVAIEMFPFGGSGTGFTRPPVPMARVGPVAPAAQKKVRIIEITL